MLIGNFIFAALVPVVLGGLAVGYLSLRMRDARAEEPDPELGIKSAYHAFLTAGILLALTGISIVAIDLLGDAFEGPQPNVPQMNPGRFPQPQPQFRPNDPFGSMSQRVAWPLVIAGVLFSLIALLLVKLGTNDPQYPSVRRTFGGIRLVVAGLAVMSAGTIIIELLFQKDMATTRPYAFGVGLLAVWFPAAAIQVFLLKRDGRLPYYVPPKPKKVRTRHEDEDTDDDEPRRGTGRRRPEPEEGQARQEDEDPRPKERRRPPRRRDEEEGD